MWTEMPHNKWVENRLSCVRQNPKPFNQLICVVFGNLLRMTHSVSWCLTSKSMLMSRKKSIRAKTIARKQKSSEQKKRKHTIKRYSIRNKHKVNILVWLVWTIFVSLLIKKTERNYNIRFEYKVIVHKFLFCLFYFGTFEKCPPTWTACWSRMNWCATIQS